MGGFRLVLVDLVPTNMLVLGGSCRSSKGGVLGAFASNTNFISLVAAEILAFIEVVHIAWVIEWKHIWIETNSMLVIHYLFKAPMLCLGSL